MSGIRWIWWEPLTFPVQNGKWTWLGGDSGALLQPCWGGSMESNHDINGGMNIVMLFDYVVCYYVAAK